MSPKKASRMWVELNVGIIPKELKHLKLDTHLEVWAEMEKLRPFASKRMVNHCWAKMQGLKNADIILEFGNP